MTYLFTPPQRVMTVLLEGSLRYSYPVSSTVWKDANGVWQSQESPYDGDLANAQMVLWGGAGRPVVVSDELAAELLATGIGQLNHIQNTYD